jgi:hypothetical protein
VASLPVAGELDPGGSPLTVEEFGLHPTPEGLDHGVVVGVTDGAHGRQQPGFSSALVNAHQACCEPVIAIDEVESRSVV